MRGNGGEPPVGFEYPCRIDIKVFIRREKSGAEVVARLVRDHVEKADLIGITRRESRGGKYLGGCPRIEAVAREAILSPFFRPLEANSYSYLTRMSGKRGQNSFSAVGSLFSGRLLALTCSVMARDRAQMDQLFRSLSGHPDILMVI
ncbi:MAG: DUF493 domain-containing protein [Pseudomonadota bacterium]|nr:DUF493 domain-containing protein [Pseudomonadota bacterium]